MEWTQVEQRIAEDDRSKWDRKAPATALRVADDGALELANGEGARDRFALSELGTTQMCQRLGIPVLYYRRLPDEMLAPRPPAPYRATMASSRQTLRRMLLPGACYGLTVAV
jgi:hypothetical protein